MKKKLIRVTNDDILELTFEEVLEKYRGLLINSIKKYKFKYEFEDLYQVSSLALWDAYEFHDSNNGKLFGSLAIKTIFYYMAPYRISDKYERETSQIKNVCSYYSNDGYVDTFIDERNNYQEVEFKILFEEVIEKLKKNNLYLRSHERIASERNIDFLKLISQGITQREIAKLYNINITTVQRGLYKEYKRIKKILKTDKLEDILSA